MGWLNPNYEGKSTTKAFNDSNKAKALAAMKHKKEKETSNTVTVGGYIGTYTGTTTYISPYGGAKYYPPIEEYGWVANKNALKQFIRDIADDKSVTEAITALFPSAPWDDIAQELVTEAESAKVLAKISQQNVELAGKLFDSICKELYGTGVISCDDLI